MVDIDYDYALHTEKIIMTYLLHPSEQEGSKPYVKRENHYAAVQIHFETKME